ncbi:MAG: sulfurtransferase [Kangiellaceae bacterium]|nr:sulfurtransferase [Kangiellaceae bacterium]
MNKNSSNLKSVEWLKESLSDSNLVILDASMVKKPNGDLIPPSDHCIPNTRRFNYDCEICDQSTHLPHMMPTQADFQSAARQLGINNDSTIVVYDAIGIFASPRAWWMFKSMGHDKVYVLDGGLPKWDEENYPVVSDYSADCDFGNFIAKLDGERIASMSKVRSSIDDNDTLLIDARSTARFLAKENEPRKELVSGHIPNSVCLPFTELLENNLIRKSDDLKRAFDDRIKSADKNIIFSCGSGVTACILALGASECGYDDYAVYDGSWTEWALDDTSPKITI